MKFYDRPECITLSPHVDAYGTKSGIFLFKNYIKKSLVEKIESQLNKTNLYASDKNLIDWYEGKMTESPEGLIDVWEEISILIGPEWVMHPAFHLISLKPGDNGMFIHSDSPGKNMCHLLSQNDTWTTCCLLDYGVVAYFGDFEGGEIFYPSINPDGSIKSENNNQVGCFEYKPEKGDVLIHSAFDPYGHGVREVKSGLRYAYSNFSLKSIDNPGTFYNYGTVEYFKQVGKKTEKDLEAWSTPLKINKQFIPEKVEEMKKSALRGKDLANKFFKDYLE